MKHEALSEQLIGIFHEVYNELGQGFLENIYQKAFKVLMAERNLPFQEQMPIEVVFHGISLGEFRADLVADSRVLLELKAVSALERAHEKQVLNYLKATKLEVGLLLNFGPRAQVRRFVLDNDLKATKAAAAGSST